MNSIRLIMATGITLSDELSDEHVPARNLLVQGSAGAIAGALIGGGGGCSRGGVSLQRQLRVDQLHLVVVVVQTIKT